MQMFQEQNSLLVSCFCIDAFQVLLFISLRKEHQKKCPKKKKTFFFHQGFQ